jgi:tight adherence protein B
MTALIIIGLTMLAAGGLVHVFVYPHISGDIKAEKRQTALRSPGLKYRADRQADAANRRKQIAQTLQEAGEKGKKRHSLETRIAQAGLTWSRSKFIAASTASAVFFGGLVWLAGVHLLVVGPAMVVGGIGLPVWGLSFLRKRRLKKFVEEFPNAIDIIIRGVKAGLPFGECLRIIAAESAEPVRSEFRQIVEAQAVGLSTSEAVERIVERVPIAEASFFSIVVSIQQKAGGNLAEAFGNLSSVLRDRKKMQAKVKAISSEAKASAYIIGTLPFLVGGMVYLTSPKYMELLWTTPSGQLVMAGSALWMGIGVFVMKNMINFDI